MSMTPLQVWEHYINHFATKPLWEYTQRGWDQLVKKVAKYIKEEKALEDISHVR